MSGLGGIDWSDDTDDDEDYDIKECRKCGKTPETEGKNKVCSRCKSVSYCSKECQVEDWSKHKKACKFLKQERLMTKAVTDLHNSEQMKRMLASVNPEQMRAAGLDPNGLDGEEGQFRMQEVVAAYSSKKQMQSLLEKYKDADLDKTAHKLLKAVRFNHDRHALHLEIYRHLLRNPQLWDACFATDAMVEKFFDALAVVIENDIKIMDGLDYGLSDRIIPSASLYVLYHLFYTPIEGRRVGTREEENERCMAELRGEKQKEVVMRLEKEKVMCYFKTCWKEHLDLCLSMYTAYQKGITNLMKDCHRTWKDTYACLTVKDIAHQLFQSAVARHNIPFHAPQSPSLAPLIAMLNVRGSGIAKFKHWVYAVAAALIVQARVIQDQNIVSASLLEDALCANLSDMSEGFLVAAIEIADATIHRGAALDFDKFLASRPEIKDRL